MFGKVCCFKMMRNVVLILLSLRFSYGQNDVSLQEMERTHCFYSRYAYYYIILINKVFDLTIGSFQVGSITMQPPMKTIFDYEEILQSQGYIFMAMLEDLRFQRPDYRIPADLMKMNLYLNHVVGYTRLLAQTLHPGTDPTKRTIYERGFKVAQNQTWQEIENNLENNLKCSQYRPDADKTLPWHVQDQEQPFDSSKFKLLNRLLLPRTGARMDLKSFVFDQLAEKKRLFNMIFFEIFKRETHLKFLPHRMLFKLFMPSGHGSSSDTDDKSYLMRSVTVAQSEGGHDNDKTIYDLFIGGMTNFSKDFVLSFQHRVLAASIHPVLMCASTFLTVIDRLFYPGENKFGDVSSRVAAHEITLKRHGIALLGHFKAFIDLKLFTGLTQEHLAYMHSCLSRFVGNLGRQLHLQSDMSIPKLLRMYSRPMEVNKFHYHVLVETFPMDTEEEVLQLVDTVERDIEEIGKYVAHLSIVEHTFAFQMVINTFYHDEIFLRDPSIPRPINNSGITNSEYNMKREVAVRVEGKGKSISTE